MAETWRKTLSGGMFAMTGRRLGSFRSGDRSEYLAVYALSRFAFVDPIPRQEDFGVVDFLCILARSEPPYVYPESAFYVQVKSNTAPIELSGGSIAWLAHHMDHPLFMCVIDKDQSLVSLYSCAVIWNAVFRSRVEPRSIRVEFDGEAQVVEATPGSLNYTVNLGAPILSQTVSEVEKDPEAGYMVLRDWIALDAANIARRRVGRVQSRRSRSGRRMYRFPALVRLLPRPTSLALTSNWSRKTWRPS